MQRSAKLAAAAEVLKRQSGSASPFSLAFLTDQMRAPDPFAIVRAMPADAAVILRDYEMADREAHAKALQSACADRNIAFLVGDDIDLARAIGADGVHFPSRRHAAMSPIKDLIVTTSCHNEEEIRLAGINGVDLVFLGPAFPTQSHPDAPALGAAAFRRLAAQSAAPVLALGGVTEENAHALIGKNVTGIAAIGAFLG